MRFFTVKIQDNYVPLASADGGIIGYSLKDLGFSDLSIAEFIRNDAFEKLSKLKENIKNIDKNKEIQINTTKICSPIMKPDYDILCLGINYKEHAEEAQKFSKDAFNGDYQYTSYFSKKVNYTSGLGDPIPSYPDLVEGLDYEVELGVILGKTIKKPTIDEAYNSIFGYTIINDISARNIQTRHNQWFLGKSLDGFAPMGPCIVTADELKKPHNLEISCSVNGELRQKSNTNQMIQTVENAIVELSAAMTLSAGTIISTGTPSGVGMGYNPPRFLSKGDVVLCEIEAIGKLENFVE